MSIDQLHWNEINEQWCDNTNDHFIREEDGRWKVTARYWFRFPQVSHKEYACMIRDPFWFDTEREAKEWLMEYLRRWVF
jgi:hypothetical protein